MKNKISYKVKKELSFLVLMIVSAFVGIEISISILYLIDLI